MEMRKNQRGFSLIEVIIVIAIMAVLIGILAPQYLKYVEQSKRVKDSHTAEEIAREWSILITDQVGLQGKLVVGYDDTGTTYDMWRRSTYLEVAEYYGMTEEEMIADLSKPMVPDGSYQTMGLLFDALNCIPESEAHPDWFWIVEYETDTAEVIKVELGETLDGLSISRYVEVWPDASAYIEGNY